MNFLNIFIVFFYCKKTCSEIFSFLKPVQTHCDTLTGIETRLSTGCCNFALATGHEVSRNDL